MNTARELAPEGTGYRSKTRFSKFYNLPELMSMFKEIADIQTADTLNLPVPKVNAYTIDVDASDIQKGMVQDLAKRAERIRKKQVNSKTDNMLRITNEGRKLALDQRIINDMLPDYENGKVNVCANNIYKIWEKTKDKKSTQLVFCDLSTPKSLGTEDNPYEMEFLNGEWYLKDRPFTDVYTDLKRKLISKGIPEDEIAFIHDATTETKKKELFAKVKSGNIRVLMGSTSKMGAGTNVQNKIKAIHHLDVPWRPSDLQQRNGRGVRQGNENEEIDIYTYVTKGTFDAYSYQTVERKQRGVSQIMTSKVISRSEEDIDEKALSYAEIKALATGNPLIIEKAELEEQSSKLKILKQSYLSEIYRLEDAIVKFYPVEIKNNEELISNMQKDLELVKENTELNNEDKFSPIILKGKQYVKKEDAGKMILEICKSKENKEIEEIGKYRGLKMELEIVAGDYILALKGESAYSIKLGKDVFGNITRMDNAITDIEKKLNNTNNDLENLKQQFENAKIQVKVPFDKERELQEKIIRLNEVNKELEIKDNEHEMVDDEIEEQEDYIPEKDNRSYELEAR